MKGTDTIKFITKGEFPSEKRVTYGIIVVEEKPNKT